MNISILLKVVGVGLLVAVAHQILSKSGREDLATWVSIGGIVLVLVLLMGILGIWIVRMFAPDARDRFGALLAAGISTHLALQTFLNIGVVTNFLPATGISLPFFSYGGTALLLQLFEMGVVLAVSRQCDNKLL